jgi:hypothetical protein
MLPGGEDRAGTDVNRLLLVRLRGGGVGVGHTTRINCVILHARVVAFGRQGSQIQMTEIAAHSAVSYSLPLSSPF